MEEKKRRTKEGTKNEETKNEGRNEGRGGVGGVRCRDGEGGEMAVYRKKEIRDEEENGKSSKWKRRINGMRKKKRSRRGQKDVVGGREGNVIERGTDEDI